MGAESTREVRGEPEEQLFDPDFLARLRTLFFKLRRRRQLRKKGLQQTRAAGFTREFKDRRAYTSRDDFRTIDWRLFARLEKLYVRLFEEVQEFHVHVLVDRSRSMCDPYGTKRLTSLRLAVALAYLGLMNQHRVSLLTFAEDLRQELPPLLGQGHIHEVLKTCAALEHAGETDLEGCLARFRPGRDRRGMVFLLSDLLTEEPARTAQALQHATRWPAETHVVHVLDPRELAPPLEGEVQLVDVETGERRRFSLTREDLERYRQSVARYLAEVEQGCRLKGVDYLTWTTDLSFEQAFLNLLSRGSPLTQGA